MTLARAANRAFDRGDLFSFDLMATCREIDEAIRNTPTDELEARLAQITDAHRSLERAVSTNQPPHAA